MPGRQYLRNISKRNISREFIKFPFHDFHASTSVLISRENIRDFSVSPDHLKNVMRLECTFVKLLYDINLISNYG